MINISPIKDWGRKYLHFQCLNCKWKFYTKINPFKFNKFEEVHCEDPCPMCGKMNEKSTEKPLSN